MSSKNDPRRRSRSVGALAMLSAATLCIVLAAPGRAATAPGAPNITGMTTTQSTATITWQAPSSDGGSPITTYVATATPSVATNPTRTCTTSGATTCTISGLINGAMYSVTVVAGNPTLGPPSAPWYDAPIGSGTPVVQHLPLITGISPFYGPKRGGTRLTITGNNLRGATKVTFNGKKGTHLVQVSPTKIKVTTPRSTTGPATIWVTTPKGRLMSQSYVFVE